MFEVCVFAVASPKTFPQKTAMYTFATYLDWILSGTFTLEVPG